MFLKMKLNNEKRYFAHTAKQKNFLYRNVITCRLFAFIKPTCDKIISKYTHYRFFKGPIKI